MPAAPQAVLLTARLRLGGGSLDLTLHQRVEKRQHPRVLLRRLRAHVRAERLPADRYIPGSQGTEKPRLFTVADIRINIIKITENNQCL